MYLFVYEDSSKGSLNPMTSFVVDPEGFWKVTLAPLWSRVRRSENIFTTSN
jgi:hypothetical protein